MLIFLQCAATARAFLGSGLGLSLLLFAGCAGLIPQVPTPAADPAADPAAGAATAPPRSVLGMDEPTRKTQQLLAATGATRLEGLKPMKHDMPMDGMDHGGREGMKNMPGMDHSKMPGMEKPPSVSTPAGKPQPGSMPGMEHSKMPELKEGSDGQGTAQPQQSAGESADHGVHGDQPTAPPTSVAPP